MYLCFFFNYTATTEIYTLSLHDALPISGSSPRATTAATTASPSGRSHGSSANAPAARSTRPPSRRATSSVPAVTARSEEHTSELQSRQYLVCRLLLEKKKN